MRLPRTLSRRTSTRSTSASRRSAPGRSCPRAPSPRTCARRTARSKRPLALLLIKGECRRVDLYSPAFALDPHEGRDQPGRRVPVLRRRASVGFSGGRPRGPRRWSRRPGRAGRAGRSSMIRAGTTSASSTPRSSARGMPTGRRRRTETQRSSGQAHARGLAEEAEEEPVLDDEHDDGGPAVASRVGEGQRELTSTHRIQSRTSAPNRRNSGAGSQPRASLGVTVPSASRILPRCARPTGTTRVSGLTQVRPAA